MIIETKHNQTTISKEVSLKGVGLHTGKEVDLTFSPSEANTGYIFKIALTNLFFTSLLLRSSSLKTR